MSNILTENLRSTDEVTSSSASYLHSNAVIESEKTKDTCLLYSNEACFDLQFSEIIPLTSSQFDFLDTIVSDMDNDTAFDDIVSNVHAPMDVNKSYTRYSRKSTHIPKSTNNEYEYDECSIYVHSEIKLLPRNPIKSFVVVNELGIQRKK